MLIWLLVCTEYNVFPCHTNGSIGGGTLVDKSLSVLFVFVVNIFEWDYKGSVYISCC